MVIKKLDISFVSFEILTSVFKKFNGKVKFLTKSCKKSKMNIEKCYIQL